MNIFRSEEDARAWARFDSNQAAIIPVAGVVQMFAHPLFSERLKQDYYGRQGDLFRQFMSGAAG